MTHQFENGADVVAAVKAAARSKGVPVLRFIAPLSASPHRWLRDVAQASHPREVTLARVRALLDGNDPDLVARFVTLRGEGEGPGGTWRVIGFKVFYDGSLGSRTALLHAPYADAPHEHNAIERIQGLEALASLTSLWLGANRISSICDALMASTSLEELVLAGNQISNFKDIPNLARMRRLTSISFAEPHFGDNPLCSLCNYQTYVTYHLTQLASLDMEHISDDAKRLARAIYLKKKMYYNMRMKTLKRDATNIITKAQEMHQSKMKGFDDCVRTLLRLQ